MLQEPLARRVFWQPGEVRPPGEPARLKRQGEHAAQDAKVAVDRPRLSAASAPGLGVLAHGLCRDIHGAHTTEEGPQAGDTGEGPLQPRRGHALSVRSAM